MLSFFVSSEMHSCRFQDFCGPAAATQFREKYSEGQKNARALLAKFLIP